MKALKYRLADGSVVITMKEANTSGQQYITSMEEVAKARPTLSPKRKAMLDKFGYVSATLIDKT